MRPWFIALTRWDRVTHICVGNSSLKLRNTLQWNLKQSFCIFIHENAFKDIVYKMAAILSRPQLINNF